MIAPKFRSRRALLGVCTCLFAGPCAAYSIVDASYFANPNVVGVDNYVAGQNTQIGFDFFPNGDPISTPTVIPGTTGAFVSGDISNAFLSIGVTLGSDDVAISQPGNPDGIGLRSGSNALAPGGAVLDSTDPFDFSFAVAATAAGIWVTDGPTNEVAVSFFDPLDQLIVNLTAPSNVNHLFLGIETANGIQRIQVTTFGSDDYFVEDLTYITRSDVPVPGSLFLVLSGLAAVRLCSRTRRASQ
jgi:hypothetical protein